MADKTIHIFGKNGDIDLREYVDAEEVIFTL